MLLRLMTNKISFRFDKFFVLGFLFCSVISFNAVGQEERTVHHRDSSADYEEVSDLAGTEFTDSGKEGRETKANTSLSPKKETKDHLHKQRGEKDGRKEGMSTLSFNLFLYVVDRFREDN